MKKDLLTTRRAADLLGVSVSTVKRWADDGLLDCEYTPGGHRRIRRSAVRALRDASQLSRPSSEERHERQLDTPRVETVNDLVAYGARYVTDWIERLRGAPDPTALQLALSEDRARFGAWWQVADALGMVLGEIGRRWQRGEWTVVEEHVASEALRAALWRRGDDLPVAEGAPRALLATAVGEDHDVGLALVRLVLRANGWDVVWSGRRSPTQDLGRRIAVGDLNAVALSASVASIDTYALAEEVAHIANVCRTYDVQLWLGGRGLWPTTLPEGVERLYNFRELQMRLAPR